MPVDGQGAVVTATVVDVIGAACIEGEEGIMGCV